LQLWDIIFNKVIVFNEKVLNDLKECYKKYNYQFEVYTLYNFYDILKKMNKLRSIFVNFYNEITSKFWDIFNSFIKKIKEYYKYNEEEDDEDDEKEDKEQDDTGKKGGNHSIRKYKITNYNKKYIIFDTTTMIDVKNNQLIMKNKIHNVIKKTKNYIVYDNYYLFNYIKLYLPIKFYYSNNFCFILYTNGNLLCHQLNSNYIKLLKHKFIKNNKIIINDFIHINKNLDLYINNQLITS
jgi:hypothetical protein